MIFIYLIYIVVYFFAVLRSRYCSVSFCRLRFRAFEILEQMSALAHGSSSNSTVPGTRYHRRRIELEDKAKVVTSDWGTESLPR